MKTFQSKVLDEFELIANRYGCEAVQNPEGSGEGQVLALRSWKTIAYFRYQFSGGVITILFNGAILSQAVDARRTEARVFGEVGAFERWADLLFEQYTCGECDGHHRPGTDCVWEIPVSELAALVRESWPGGPLTPHAVVTKLRALGRPAVDAEVLAIYEELRAEWPGLCKECRQKNVSEHGMCEGCLHDAYRSGWEPGQ
jgi:hypothetical protein